MDIKNEVLLYFISLLIYRDATQHMNQTKVLLDTFHFNRLSLKAFSCTDSNDKTTLHIIITNLNYRNTEKTRPCECVHSECFDCIAQQLSYFSRA